MGKIVSKLLSLTQVSNIFELIKAGEIPHQNKPWKRVCRYGFILFVRLRETFQRKCKINCLLRFCAGSERSINTFVNVCYGHLQNSKSIGRINR
jgi:hypothetical protein